MILKVSWLGDQDPALYLPKKSNWYFFSISARTNYHIRSIPVRANLQKLTASFCISGQQTEVLMLCVPLKKGVPAKKLVLFDYLSHCFPGVCADEKYGEEHEKDRSPPCKTMKISLHSIMVTKFHNRNFGLPEFVIKMVKCNLFTHIYHCSFGNKGMTQETNTLQLEWFKMLLRIFRDESWIRNYFSRETSI